MTLTRWPRRAPGTSPVGRPSSRCRCFRGRDAPALVALLIAALFAAASGSMLHAASVPLAVRAEIDALLSRLSASACEFERNGSWYAAADAKAHLLRKLVYLERHDAVQTTEQFIDLAATKSSRSGKPYHVRCGKAAPLESRDWLTAELATLRDGDPGSGEGPQRAGEPASPPAP